MVHFMYYRKNEDVFVWPGIAHAPIAFKLNRQVYCVQQHISAKFHQDRLALREFRPKETCYRLIIQDGRCIMGMAFNKADNNKLCGRPPQSQYAPTLWPFDLESGVRVICDVGYLCANYILPRPLCSRLRPDVRDRQTDARQTSDAHNRLMPPSLVAGA